LEGHPPTDLDNNMTTTTATKIENVILLHSGDLSLDIANQISTKLTSIIDSQHVHL